MKLSFEEAKAFFAEFYRGEHHFPNKLRQYGEGWFMSHFGTPATLEQIKKTEAKLALARKLKDQDMVDTYTKELDKLKKGLGVTPLTKPTTIKPVPAPKPAPKPEPLPNPPKPKKTGLDIKSSGELTMEESLRYNRINKPGLDLRDYQATRFQNGMTLTTPKKDGDYLSSEVAKQLNKIPDKLFQTKPHIILYSGPSLNRSFTGGQVLATSYPRAQTVIGWSDKPGKSKIMDLRILAHELAHQLDAGGLTSNGLGWDKAIKSDQQKTGSRFVSIYAKEISEKVNVGVGLREDFADSVGSYCWYRAKFEREFPERAKFLKELLGE